MKPRDPEVVEALQHLHDTWRRLYLDGPPWSEENIRQRQAVCEKIKKWSEPPVVQPRLSMRDWATWFAPKPAAELSE